MHDIKELVKKTIPVALWGIRGVNAEHDRARLLVSHSRECGSTVADRRRDRIWSMLDDFDFH